VSDFLTGWCICGFYTQHNTAFRRSLSLPSFTVVCLSSPVEPSLRCRFGVTVSDFLTGWCICSNHTKLRQLLHTTQHCLPPLSEFAIIYHRVCLSSPVDPSLRCRYGVPVSDFVTGWCIRGSHTKLSQLLHTTQQCLPTLSKFAIVYDIVCLSSPVEPSLKCRYGVPVSDFLTGWCICCS